MRLAVVASGVLLLLARATPARADYVMVPPEPRSRLRLPGGDGPDLLYLNRCVGGCTVREDGDRNDATENVSSLSDGESQLSEFQYSDFIWDSVVACVEDTYAPYDVQVVTDEPPDDTPYVEVMVAGTPDELGQDAGTLGIALLASDCSPQVNWIAFAFANAHGTDPVIELCATVAHEAGHVYGLEHVFDCKDPMTYLTDCGHKWFLALDMACGTFSEEDCDCPRDRQNSHAVLTAALGEGTLPPPPAVTILEPGDGGEVADRFQTSGEILEERVLTRVELRFNGFPWHRVDTPERDQTDYSFRAPEELPDGVIDCELRAYNDLDLMGSQTVTVTKGEPCASDDSCLDGQACDAEGRCAWPPPTVELGGACETDADCLSFECVSDGEQSICTEVCVLGADSCPDGYRCLDNGELGVCWPSEDGGCCSAGGDPAGLGLLGLGLLFTRGRGRRSRGSRSRS